MRKTVSFSTRATNVFFHLLTQCNLKCAHCYINKSQHGDNILSLATVEAWLATLIQSKASANLVLLGGEPTLHPRLSQVVKAAKRLGYASITIDTNGYLFNDILHRIGPGEVDFFSFSLDGATARQNDAIRGRGSFDACLSGIHAASRLGFGISLITTVSTQNIDALWRMPGLLNRLPVQRFFIQVIGLRGKSAAAATGRTGQPLQVSETRWRSVVAAVAEQVAANGVPVVFPKVYLKNDEPFECAAKVADNYFVFPNARVYRCPLGEDYPINSLRVSDNRLIKTPPINESDLFQLDIPEGCVMNRLVQPGNILYREDGRPRHRIACCLLKEEMRFD